MQDFVFHNKTKVYFGKNQLDNLGAEISRFGKKDQDLTVISK